MHDDGSPALDGIFAPSAPLPIGPRPRPPARACRGPAPPDPAGAYRDALPLMERHVDAAIERDDLAHAALWVGWCSRLRTGLRDLALAERDLVRLTELARALLDVACEQFQAIGMPGWIERAEALRAQSARKETAGDRIDAVAELAVSSSATRPPAPEPPSSAAALFRHEGDFWTLAYQGAVCRVKDAKGLHYIAYLLRHPGREFHVLELIGQGLETGGWRLVEEGQRSETKDQPLETGQGLPILDAPAKAAYQQRLSALRDELDEAERNNDPGQAERARTEMDAITEQLAAAVGLGGRDRQAASSSERARSTVTKVVKAALNRISDHHAALGRHLTTSIKTGTFCSYAPDEPLALWAF